MDAGEAGWIRTNPQSIRRPLRPFAQEGNVVKLRVEEYYRACRIPLEHFEGYRTVVNAAADFNKLALVLVKG